MGVPSVEIMNPERQKDMPFRLGYVPGLDGLRGISILVVMIYHANFNLLSGGFIGVEIFFGLSGFLITALLIQEFDNAGRIKLKAFYLRRVLRLFPALLALLIVYCLTIFYLVGFRGSKPFLVDAFIALFYMSNWARALNIHPPYLLGHTWSLSIEEQFYALWPPLLVLLLWKIRSRWAIAWIAFSIAVSAWALRCYLGATGSTALRLSNGLDTKADALMVGCALGIIVASNLIQESARGILSRILRMASPVSVGILAGICKIAFWYAPIMFYWLYFIIEILTAIIILDCIINKDSMINRILSLKGLVWVGTISYGLYLWHYPVFAVMKQFRFDWVRVITLGSAITFAATTLSFYLLEKPFLRLKKKFEMQSRKEAGRVPAVQPTEV